MKPFLESLFHRKHFHAHLEGALRALQAMHERANAKGAPSSLTDPEMQELLIALANGGIQITDGEFSVTVFKRTAKESPCELR